MGYIELLQHCLVALYSIYILYVDAFILKIYKRNVYILQKKTKLWRDNANKVVNVYCTTAPQLRNSHDYSCSRQEYIYVCILTHSTYSARWVRCVVDIELVRDMSAEQNSFC